MLPDGLYRVTFKNADLNEGETGALAVLRCGRILGSDPNGGVFRGNFDRDSCDGRHAFQLTFEVPPQGATITGFLAGAGGSTLHISGSIEEHGREPVAVLDVAGKQIEVHLTYLGPLPN